MFAQDAEWSRDGLQIFFTGSDTSKRTFVYKVFWDGTGLQKYTSGMGLVAGQ
jgi:Tol biopolymer transport system component